MIQNYIRICLLAGMFILGGCATNPENERGSDYEPDKTAQLNLELGMAYLEKNDNTKALKRLKKAIQIDPKYADGHNAIAILYSRIGENDKAGTHYEKAVKLAPDDSRALNNYGQFLCTQGQRGKADTMFKRALENPLYQTPEFVHLNAGICAKGDKDYEQAEIHFREALKKNPSMVPALFNMANLSYILKRYLPARGYIERYSEVAKHGARSLWLATRIEKALGDVDAEASYALRLKNNFPDSQETRLLLKSSGGK